MAIKLKDFPDAYVSRKFVPVLWNESRYCNMIGGSGSGKSRTAAIKLLHRILTEKINHRILLVRKTLPSIRKSSWTLINDYLSTWQAKGCFSIGRSEMNLEYLPNGNQIITASMDDPEKIKSIERITGVWIEEATELDFDDFTQIDLRLRGDIGTYKQIILTYNPIDEKSWIKTMFFDKNKDDTFVHHSTVEDNEFIDKDYIHILDNLKEEDKNYYNIYRLGQWGKLEGLIYSNWDVMKAKDWPNGFEEIIYGIDFGYNNPTAILEIGFCDTVPHCRELLYQTNLTNSQLIEKMNSLKINNRANIYADCAEPARIEEIRIAGFNVYPSNKSVTDGTDYCKRGRFKIHEESTNMISELKSYKYKQDKNGNYLDDPVKFRDHLVDSMRYARFTHARQGPEPAMASFDPQPELRRRRW